MASLRKRIQKLMSERITGKTMELLIGLNDQNESELREMTECFSKKLIKAYFNAIKKQTKQAAKAKSQQQKNTTVAPVTYLEPALIAS